MPDIGLVLSGGGSKGAFTVGVLQALRVRLKLKQFRVISGTSTGALIGTMLVNDEWTKLRQIYRNVQTTNIINPHHALVAAIAGEAGVLFASAVLGGRAVYSAKALEDTIKKNVDFNKIKAAAAKTLMIYNTVNLQTGELKTYDNQQHAPQTLAKAMLASASEPVLTDPVPIRGEQYTDGGVLEFLPLGSAFGAGVKLDHIIAISTAPLKARKQGQLDKIVDILVRTIDLLNTETGRNDYEGAILFNAILQLITNAKAAGVTEAKLLRGIPRAVRDRILDKSAVPVTFIGPNTHLDMDSLKFEPDAMRKIMDKGVQVGKKEADKLKAALGI